VGCLKLHIESEPILRLAYSKKGQKPLKKVGWFYPFGGKHLGYNNIVSANGNSVAQRFGFGGKELSEELELNTLDHGARNQKVMNIKQIRASVITNWLGQYNLRKVQYLAGHRYISSTERYLQDDLENLHEIVNNFHPIS